MAPPCEPGHSYRISTKMADATYIGPDEWLNTAPQIEGVVAAVDEVVSRAI